MGLPQDGEESEGEVVGFQAEAEAEVVEELGLLLPWPIEVCASWNHNVLRFKGRLLARAEVCMCEKSWKVSISELF